MKRILVVLLLAATALAQNAPAKKQYTIQSMFTDQGAAAPPQGLQWSPDGTKISFIRRGAGGQQEALYYYDPATGKDAVLIAADALAAMNSEPPTSGSKGDDRARDNRARYGVAAYHWSPDSKSILFDTMGHLWLYNLAANRGVALTSTEEPTGDPKFSPDARYISFLRGHDLYIKSTSEGDEIRLTKDGSANLYNGEVDWLYEEELDVRSNYFWSPDSKQILFLQSNETPVPTYPIVDWIKDHPSMDPEKYPKAGDANPTAKLAVLDVTGNIKWLPLSSDPTTYVPRFGWVKPGLAWAMVLNRKQNHADLYFIDVATGKSAIVLSENDDKYLEITNSIYFFKDGSKFLWPSWRDGFTHLYLYSIGKDPMAAATLTRQLDSGSYEVQQVSGVNEPAGIVYLMANAHDDRQEHLFQLSLTGDGLVPVTNDPGVHNVSLADNDKYFVDTFSSLNEPSRMQICSTTAGTKCNEIFRSHAFDDYDRIAAKFVDFKADDGTVLHGAILLPPAGTPGADANGKYPLIMNPYGGPHGQSVRDAYTVMGAFDQILAHRGIAVLKVDNRGMGNRGKKFATITYGNLFETELKDQLAALDQAITQFPIDSNRLGWWGWSYGGSMTLWAMTHSDRFKAGVSVAPVTDWHWYDSAYTERYMDLPQDNKSGYEKTSIVKAAKGLKGDLFIAHGTSDDNVHVQNTMQFVFALENNDIPFDMRVFPQKTHAISGQKTRIGLYTRIVEQFDRVLLGKTN